MLLKEIIYINCETRTEHTNALYARYSSSLSVKAGGTYSSHCTLKALMWLCDTSLSFWVNIGWMLLHKLVHGTLHPKQSIPLPKFVIQNTEWSF
jgi:hypothetical protein